MNKIAQTVLCAMTFATGGAMAMSHMEKEKKGDATMAKPAAAMTMQQCKEHMAMAKKDGMKKDDAMMKKDTLCAEMMKKDAMAKEPAKK